jgi:hypothetical protein
VPQRLLATALLVLLGAGLSAGWAGSPSARPLAAASATSHDVPRLLRAQTRKAKERSGLRVLLPSRLTVEFERLYPDGTSADGRYSLGLGAVHRCNQATACFVAAFIGQRRGQPFGPKKVQLARGRVGRFTPLSCGASCAAPQIMWRERGALYTIQAKVGNERTERRELVALANSAIRHGAR